MKKRLMHADVWQRWTGVFVLAATLGVAVVLLLSEINTSTRFHDLSGYLYKRCLAREAYDRATADAWKAQIHELDNRIVQEATNPYVGTKLRDERVNGAQETRAALRAALSRQLPQGCQPYKP